MLTTSANFDAVSTSGLTEEQLDEYARALEVERLRLEAYHAELLAVAAALQESADSIAQATGAVPAEDSGRGEVTGKPQQASKPQAAVEPAVQPQPVAKPAPAAKPAPQQAPQAATKGS